jgi:polyhydroxyalkanoate synthesis regulator phasin
MQFTKIDINNWTRKEENSQKRSHKMVMKGRMTYE